VRRFGFDPYAGGWSYPPPPAPGDPRLVAFLAAEARALHAATGDTVVVVPPDAERTFVIGS
jgi:hypothetical protein